MVKSENFSGESLEKISKINCPTQGTLDDLSKNNIFDINKLFLLRDPIIEIKKKNFYIIKIHLIKMIIQ